MAKCVRKNCKRPVSSNPEAKRKRLCKKHYLRFCELTERKKSDPVYQINKRIPRKVKQPKRIKLIFYKLPTQYGYERSGIKKVGFAEFAYQKIKKIRGTPAWHNVESRVRRARATEKLPITLSETYELHSIYSWIHFCKKSKSFGPRYLSKEGVNINFQLCSFPLVNEKSSFLDDLIIVPTSFKNKVKNCFPTEKCSEHKVEGQERNVASLFNSLVSEVGLFHVCRVMVSFSLENPYHPYQFKKTRIAPLTSAPLLFNTLLNEVIRLNILGLYDWLYMVKKKYTNRFFSLELLAMYLLLMIMACGIDEACKSLLGNISDDGEVDFSIITSLLMNGFKFKQNDDLIRFYNEIYTCDIITYDKDKKIIYWHWGKYEYFEF